MRGLEDRQVPKRAAGSRPRTGRRLLRPVVRLGVCFALGSSGGCAFLTSIGTEYCIRNEQLITHVTRT